MFKKYSLSFTSHESDNAMVIVILIVLAAIAIPNFLKAQNQVKDNQTQKNMTEIKAIFDTYFKLNKEKQPEKFILIRKDAEKKGYWKVLQNPFDKKELKVLNLKSIPHSNDSKEINFQPGDLGYILNNRNYVIYGFGKENKLIEVNGRVFYLTNN